MIEKSPNAFRTISEVADALDLPAHVLRFWESKFTQIKPIKRGGGRRYYRPDDVDLIRGIRNLLYADGITIKGVQKILRQQGIRHVIQLGAEDASQWDKAVHTPKPELISKPVVTEFAEPAAPAPVQPPEQVEPPEEASRFIPTPLGPTLPNPSEDALPEPPKYHGKDAAPTVDPTADQSEADAMAAIAEEMEPNLFTHAQSGNAAERDLNDSLLLPFDETVLRQLAAIAEGESQSRAALSDIVRKLEHLRDAMRDQ